MIYKYKIDQLTDEEYDLLLAIINKYSKNEIKESLIKSLRGDFIEQALAAAEKEIKEEGKILLASLKEKLNSYQSPVIE